MTNFVSIESSDKDIKLKNLYFVWIFIWFIWILFHFTIVFFFWMMLNSVFLVGIFLWIWNLIALLVDIPIWVLQKYIKSKTFLLIASSFMFLVSLIFLKFIYFKWISWLFLPPNPEEKWIIIQYSSIFLDSWLNIFLILLAAVCYWIIKESYDVTILSYILNIWTPSEYAWFISKYNIFNWIWSLIWLIISWILLAINIKIAVIIFVIIIWLFILFLKKYFDNHKETIEFEKIKTLKIDTLKKNLLEKREELVSKITPQLVVELSKQTKVILLKPIEIKNSINFDEVLEVTISWFKVFYKIIATIPINFLIIWFLIVILQYWFWDTFVSTFQVEFLEKIIKLNLDSFIIKNTWWIISWYVLLWLIVIPAFALQDFFINLSKKISEFKIIMFWVLLSAWSMFCFWIFNNINISIIAWLINSVWYAASMPLAQSVFSWLYNEEYSKKMNLNQIDSTVSAAPLKIILNLANVVWLILWSLLVWLLNFNWFFIFFSLVLFWFFVYSMLNMKKFSNNKIDEMSSIKEEVKENLKEIKKDVDFE